MATQRDMVKVEAARRGTAAAVAAVTTLVLVGLTVPLQLLWLTMAVLLAGLTWTGARTWQWLRYRGENGLRF